VLALLAVWLLATLGVRPLLLPDEGRYAEVAREMLMGDGLVPLINGLPFFHKPPLTYWADMAGMALFGANPFTARLGPALGAWLMGASLWLWLRRQQGARAAGIGLLALATSPGFFIGGQYANHDMLVAGTITLALLCLARALENGRPTLGWLCAGWVACALAVLSKGLIGLVLPAIVIGPWLLAQGRWRDMLGLLHPLGIVLFAAVALPWMLLMQQRFPLFFDYFIVEQHFRRYATSGFNNQHGVWFYFGVLTLFTLPWCLSLIPGVRKLWAGRQALVADGWAALFAGQGRWTMLMVWWLAAILVFFSLPASKLAGYILPVLAPACALLAMVAQQGKWWRAAAGAGAALSLVIVASLAWKAPNSGRDVARALRSQLQPHDLVVMVDNNFNDVSFEAQLKVPPLVASRWDDPELPHHDNWRKELADTARFAPERTAQLLYPLEALPQLVCKGRNVWFVTHASDAAMVAAVPGAQLIKQGRFAQLWRAAPRTCATLG
jgi:4-amino-4-deoxy-L-arabinose transferase-like glycosyltransferase